MPFIAGVLIIFQIGFAIHAVKTGREPYWLLIISLLPGLGCAAYFFTQVLPEINQSHSVNKVGNSLLKSVDPQREIRARKLELETADTVENRRKLAEECIAANFPEDAIELLEGCLRPGLEHDPYLLLELATAYFKADKFDQARTTLELLIEKNPDFKSHDGHLLYARSLENTAATDQALQEYDSLAGSYPGEEGRVRYGLLLKKLGRTDEASKWFKESIARAKRAPAYYRKKEKHWLNIAREHSG